MKSLETIQHTNRHINVRDKKTMRQRLAATRMVTPANVQIEHWNPGDETMDITYGCAPSLFGEILVGATSKGVCFLGFTVNDREAALRDLKRRFPSNRILEGASLFQNAALMQLNNPLQPLPVCLHLKGTPFQLRIWEQLLRIPPGGVTTYAKLGGNTRTARAAGHAVGGNPVGFLLPCHRVIGSDGSFNRYFWGPELKEKLLTWEAEAAM